MIQSNYEIMDAQILDDVFERDPIRFPRDKRYRVRAFRYFIYACVLAMVWAYLKVTYMTNHTPFTSPTDDRNALIGIAAARLAQLLYMVVGVFFLVKSVLAKERNDGFKIGSVVGLVFLMVHIIFYAYKMLIYL